MAVIQTIGGFTTGSGRTLKMQKSTESNGSGSISDAVADSSTDFLIALVIDISQLQNFYIQSDQDVTLEFNNSTTGVPTIALKANVPFVWTREIAAYFDPAVTIGAEAPFTSDITALYVTNASGSTAHVDAEWLVDVTV